VDETLLPEGECETGSPELIVDAPNGSSQHSTLHFQYDETSDQDFERILDYQPDGIHLQQTRRHGSHIVGGVDSTDFVPIDASNEVCSPIPPSPLILPTGARPGYRVSFAMVCLETKTEPLTVDQVSVAITATMKVRLRGTWTNTWVVQTTDTRTGRGGSGWTESRRDWVISRNGLVAWEDWTSSGTWYTFAVNNREVIALETCSTCPPPNLY
jgi:hypothetical protein